MMLWMLWATAITALLGLAALLGEGALRVSGRQGRWAWAVAIAGVLVLQLWSVLRPLRPGSPGTGADGFLGDALAGLPVFFVEGIEAAVVSAPALLERLEPFVLIVWLGASVLLLAGLVGGLLRLRRQATHWHAGRVEGLEVLVSEDFGPALVGVWSPRIVVPRWAFSLTSEALRMACVHEAEHRAARDTWLLFGGALLVAITPWNVALWWQVIRLRQAIEVDCDRRVLNTGVSKSSYGALLLELGAHPRGVTASAVALAQSTSLIERRLTVMMTDVKRTGPIRTATVLAAVVLLAFAACEAPAPTVTQLSPDAEVTEVPANWVVSPQAAEVQLDGQLVLRGTPDMILADLVAQGEAPLVYVDGVRISNSAIPGVLEELSSDDIASIEVLKGPETQAAYGSEAAPGVIQILTKAEADRIVEADLDTDAPATREQVSITSMQQMLSARTPGLNFTRQSGGLGAAASINIRGFSSISIGNQPLIYVDGIRVDNSLGDAGGSAGSALDDINPEDIESIEIIKGPAAEALYGSEAAAGVIQIVTKP